MMVMESTKPFQSMIKGVTKRKYIQDIFYFVSKYKQDELDLNKIDETKFQFGAEMASKYVIRLINDTMEEMEKELDKLRRVKDGK